MNAELPAEIFNIVIYEARLQFCHRKIGNQRAKTFFLVMGEPSFICLKA